MSKVRKGVVKVTLFFPLFDNDGRPIGQETWEWWDTEFSKLAAGFSDMGVVRGWWQGYSDVNRWIVLVVDGENEIGRIRAFLKNARRRFRQKAMYLEFHQVTFEEVA